MSSESPEAPPEGWIHELPVRVQFEDVDQYGIVHHPKYLNFMERARVDLMRIVGMRPGAHEMLGLGLIVVAIDIRYRSSARFLDDVVVRQGCRKVGSSRIELDYLVARDDAPLAEATITLAFVDSDGRPCRGPDALRTSLRRMGTPLA